MRRAMPPGAQHPHGLFKRCCTSGRFTFRQCSITMRQLRPSRNVQIRSPRVSAKALASNFDWTWHSRMRQRSFRRNVVERHVNPSRLSGMSDRLRRFQDGAVITYSRAIAMIVGLNNFRAAVGSIGRWLKRSRGRHYANDIPIVGRRPDCAVCHASADGISVSVTAFDKGAWRSKSLAYLAWIAQEYGKSADGRVANGLKKRGHLAKSKLEKLRARDPARFPAPRDGEFKLITGGWDSAAVDVDGKLIFKFPRNKAACEALRHEAAFSRSRGRPFRSPSRICSFTKVRRSFPAI